MKVKRKKFSSIYIHHERRRILVLLCIVLWSVIFYQGLHQWVVGSVIIQGDSMHPTLQDGEKYLFHRWPYYFEDPSRGDIVVVQDPMDGVEIIKRVIGEPGDKVKIKSGQVYVNGKMLKEHYLPEGMKTSFGQLGRRIHEVSSRHYFVLGDNRQDSYDSRFTGSMHEKNIQGKIDV